MKHEQEIRAEAVPAPPSAERELLQAIVHRMKTAKTYEANYLLSDIEGELSAVLAALLSSAPALAPQSTALQRYKECSAADDGDDPVECLRFFCSLAMNAQDWEDVEQFFDAIKPPSGLQPTEQQAWPTS